MFFFFNDTATTEIYTLSLHDALPISHQGLSRLFYDDGKSTRVLPSGASVSTNTFDYLGVLPLLGRTISEQDGRPEDRKSTRLNSSHGYISYAVFCLKKKTIVRVRPQN